MTLEQFWSRVFSLCLKFNGSWTSGLRTRKRNRLKGGKPNSRHQSGYAIDVVLDNWEDKWAFTTAAEMVDIRAVDEVATRGHIHCQPWDPSIGRVEWTD